MKVSELVGKKDFSWRARAQERGCEVKNSKSIHIHM